MKSNKGLNLASGVCVPYIFLLFMTQNGVVVGGMGLLIVLTNLIFSVLAAVGG